MSIRIVVLFLFLSGTSLLAQETINNASISGRVTDPSGAAVSTASVEARQVETNLATTTATDSESRFRFPYLRVGNYEINVTKTGFATGTRKVTLTIGAAFQLPISLAVASAQET